MYDIAIVGDLHLAPRAGSRIDNYFESLLDKVEEISNTCKNVIFLGDVFEHETMPLEYFQKLFAALNYRITVKGNKYYSIIGNHDIYNELESTLPRTTLGLCDLTKIIQVIKPEEVLTITGIGTKQFEYNFIGSYVRPDKCFKHVASLEGKLNDNDILLLHQHFQEYDGFEYEHLRNLGCKRVFFGHEHKPLDGGKLEFPELTVYRCGSCGRNKAEPYQLNRHIFYYILHDNEMMLSTVECMKPGVDVFTEDAYNQTNLKKTHFIRNISAVVDKYSNNISTQDKFSIKNVLQELNTPQNSMQYLDILYGRIGQPFI